MPQDALVILSHFPTVAAAMVVRSHLDERGIPALLDSGAAMFAHAGARLLVATSDLDRALILLRDEFGETAGNAWSCDGCGEVIPASDDVCQLCGAERVDQAERIDRELDEAEWEHLDGGRLREDEGDGTGFEAVFGRAVRAVVLIIACILAVLGVILYIEN